MQIVEVTQELTLESDAFPRRPDGQDPVRSQGTVHLTEVIRDLMEVSQMQRTASGSVWGRSELDLAAETGFMWEEMISTALKDRLPCRIGEVELDGIVMSPDGIEVYNGESILSEYKVVWASSSKSPADNFKWMAQVKGYCKALGMTKVRMYILYLNGNWKPPQPQYKCFLIEFTELELQENWDMILGHARAKKWIK